MTTIFVDRQGQKFEVDDPSRPEVAAWIQQNGMKADKPSTLKDVTKSAISGGIEGIVRAPLIFGDLLKLGMTGVNLARPDTFAPETVNRFGSQAWIDAFKDSPQDKGLQDTIGLEAAYDPQTRAGRYTKAGASAISGAAATGGIGAIPGIARSGAAGLNASKIALSPPMLGIEGASGVAGEFGYDVSRGFDEKSQGNPLIALLFALGTGVGGNAVRTGMKSNYPRDIYNATKGMKPAEWDKAVQELMDFQVSGSKTFTLADLPELQPRLGGLTKGMSNTAGADTLRQKLSLQHRTNKDIPSLLDSVVTDVYPKTVDPRDLTTRVAKKGDDLVEALVGQRSKDLHKTLQSAATVEPLDLLDATNRNVRQKLIRGENQGEGMQKALTEAERALLGPDARKAAMIGQVNPPVLHAQALSQNVKGLRNIPTREAGNPKTAITNYDRMVAGDAAEKALLESSPEFGQAMKKYKQFTETVVDPVDQALPGQIKDVKDANGLIAQLRKVPPNKLQQELVMLGLSNDDVLQVASVLGSKLSVIPNVARASDLNKLDREIFDKLVDFVNPDLAKSTGKKLGVADSLARLSEEHSTDVTQRMNMSKTPMQWINPMGTGSFRAGLARGEKEAAKLSDILANPTAENLSKLREMSKTDPRAKRALEWIASLTGAIQSSTAERGGQ